MNKILSELLNNKDLYLNAFPYGTNRENGLQYRIVGKYVNFNSLFRTYNLLLENIKYQKLNGNLQFEIRTEDTVIESWISKM